jgi:peptidoglycan L-alanyl-D-glutamate endopeptidase CwlK
MSRDIEKLLPIVKEKALLLQKLAKEKLGLRIIFTQTLRTNDEQIALFAQGRQSLGNVNGLRQIAGMPPITEKENHRVTNARDASSSFHGYGMAFDIAITDSTGKKIIWNDKSDWNEDGVSDWIQVGKLGEELGLEWGGNFSSISDPPHFQYRYGLTIGELKAGKRPSNP